MSSKFSVPRGTHDILPEESPIWEKLEAKSRHILKLYGYRELRTPIYEDVSLFKRSLGDTSDVVNKQLLELKTSDDDGLALRPEGTAAIVRSYVENSFDRKESISKLFYLGPMFRGERPQKGRLRQFHQLGVEVIGPAAVSPLLDAEVLALCMHLLKEFGVKGPRLLINSLGSQADKEHVSTWLREQFASRRESLCPDCQSRYERNVFRVLDCKNPACKQVVNSIMGDGKGLPLSPESIAYFEQVKASLTDLGIAFTVAPHLVRGLDYYTHTVFEITAEGLGSQDAVGAGGRYSGLVHQLGGSEKTAFGAIGFALGIERLLLASGQTQPVEQTIDAYVIAMDQAYQPKAFAILQSLRNSGISADMSYNASSMKSQMSRANKLTAKFALIIGEEEIKNNTVAVKDMRAATQEVIAQQDVVKYLENKF